MPINKKEIALRLVQAQQHQGTYVGVHIDSKSSKDLHSWAQEQNIVNPTKPNDYHVTIVYSRKVIPYKTLDNLNEEAKIIDLRKFDKALVALLDSPFLHNRFRYGRNIGATSDYPEYRPHITLSEDNDLTDEQLKNIPLPNIPIRLTKEYIEPLTFNESATSPTNLNLSQLWELPNNKLKLALAQMTSSEALRILNNAGILLTSPEEFKASYRKWMLKNHPDVGGDAKLAQIINAAYDYIKLHGLPHNIQRKQEPQDKPNEGINVPTWAWAGYSGGLPPSFHIYRQDYRDYNYIKKHLWEIGGKPPYYHKYEWTILGYDGRFFRNLVTVLVNLTKGGSKLIAEMAHAMYIWQTQGGNPYPCRAVFISHYHSRTSELIFLDGRNIIQPIPFTHKSKNPANDPLFVKKLPEELDKISGKRYPTFYTRSLFELAQRGQSDPNAVVAAIKVMVTLIRAYNEAWPSQEVANNLNNWIREGTSFFQKYHIPLRNINSLVQMISNKQWDKENQRLMQRWNDLLEDIGRPLKKAKSNIEHDLGISKPLRQFLRYIAIYLTTQHAERSENNYKNIWKLISLLRDPQITRDWKTVESTEEAPNFAAEQSGIADHLSRVVQQITGKPGYTLGVDLEQQLGKETGKRKDLYEEYKQIRLAARNIWRRALDYIIRVSGQHYIDYENARKQLLQMGLKYVPMPNGFDGNIGFHEGNVTLYTKEGHAIQSGAWARPDATISMNPDYEPESEDNIYVARLHHPSFQNPQPLYTFKGLKSGRLIKWDTVQKDLENIREFSSRWEKDINNPDPKIWLQALVTYFLYQTAARIGSQGNRAKGVDTYGISTCLVKHLHQNGNTYIFEYTGKDAIEQTNSAEVDGNMIARVTKRMLELLQGKKSNDLVFTLGNIGVNSNSVGAYMRGIGMASSAHGMRYIRGTLLAREIIKSSNWKPDPKSRISEENQAKNFIINTIAIPVGRLLGHKKGSGQVLATTSLKSYIDPNLFRELFAKWKLLYPKWLPEIT